MRDSKMMGEFVIPDGTASFGISDLQGADFLTAFALNELAYFCHANAVRRGFWESFDYDDPRHILSVLALIGTEVSEAVEAVRKDDTENFAEELADILIRVFDVAGAMDVNIGRMVLDKMEKNRGRSFKHGKTC